jgi:hypothetical protein
MGAVVLESRAKPSVKQVPSFQVVDGQQRLTTFQLFLTAARHYAQSISHQTTVGNITRYMLNSDPHLMEDPEVEIYKVWPTQSNRKLFMDIVSSKDRAALKKTHADHWYANAKRDQVKEYTSVPSMLRAYGYFYDRIKHSVETDDLHDDLVEAPDTEDGPDPAAEDEIPKELKLDAIWQSLLEEFQVVEIVLDEGDDAQVIFETLNDRGTPLLAADLIKKAAKVKKGSGVPHKEKVGSITKDQVREIAEKKMPDLNANDIDAAMKIVEGTARSMGIETP